MKRTLPFVALVGIFIVSFSLLMPSARMQTPPPECQAGRGGMVYARGGDVVVEILQGNPGAIFTSEIRLLSPGSVQTVGTNRQVGRTVNLGRFPIGTELIFGIVVNDTTTPGTFTYSMGPASRNPDGVVHADVACLSNGTSDVSFEDGYAGGDSSYNDVIFQVRTTAARVESLVFENIDSPLDANPNAGGGRRIYPDKQSATDMVNRRRARVTATTSFGVNTPIYFRSFDLDDPSTDASPVDPNGSMGDDNRGTPLPGTLSQVGATGTSSTVTVQTDANGLARADFTTTLQPGDNFMIAASHDQAYLNGLTVNGITLRDSTGQTLPTDRAKATEMLTVWRRLHVEVDSMGLVAGNAVNGLVLSASPGGTPTSTMLDVNQTLEVSRFENGRIRITGVGDFPVIGNLVGQVEVQGIIPSASIPAAGVKFSLVDDDDFNSNDGTILDGDNGEDVDALNDTFSLMQDSDNPAQNVYAPAYIRPDYDWARDAGYNGNVSFILNIIAFPSVIEGQFAFVRGSSDSESNDFWVTYIQVAYQPDDREDEDPNNEFGTAGYTTGFATFVDGTSSGSQGVPRGSHGSLIFIESMRDLDTPPTLGRDFRIRAVPHETGHQFGLRGDAAGYGIMSTGETLTFVPTHLNVLRWRIKSPGQP